MATLTDVKSGAAPVVLDPVQTAKLEKALQDIQEVMVLANVATMDTKTSRGPSPKTGENQAHFVSS